MLNCVPLAITSFLKVPHERLIRIYRQKTQLSSHPSGNFADPSAARPQCRAVFMGTPQIVVPVLDALCDYPDTEVVAAYTQPDRQRGRGRVLEPTPVKSRANDLGIPVMQPSSLRDPGALADLRALAPDVIVVAAYGRILPAAVLEAPRFGCLNLHPSLLPRHRGPSPVAGAILAGDDATGVTLMLLDEGMDSGPIVAQRSRALDAADDAERLTAELFMDGASLLIDTLPGWLSGEVPAIAQDEELVTFTTRLERSHGLADWTLDAETIARRQRAYTPWPGLFTHWEGKQLKLLDVASRTDAGAGPGVVSSADPPAIVIGAAEGSVIVRRLQLEGRRPVDAAEFLRGYPDIVGARLQ